VAAPPPPLATLLISFGIGTGVVFLVVEPVTERAAFRNSESQSDV
jgi:hypothetical protein